MSGQAVLKSEGPFSSPLNEIKAGVERLIQHSEAVPENDRRHSRRFPFPYPIHLTPVEDDGITPANETIVVLGKHLGERGLDFYYRTPLVHRRVIVSLECANEQWISFLMNLNWCRFSRHGWYENGGKFIKALNLLPDQLPFSRIVDVA
mgnify:FL=1